MRSVTLRPKTDISDKQAATIASVVAACERLLAGGESFTALSTEQLAREAGIARATFYLHFKNKGEIVRHLIAQVAREVRHAAKASLSNLDHFGRDDFLAFMVEAVEVQYRHRAAMRATVELAAYDPGVADIYQHFMAEVIGDFHRIIAKLEASGRSAPGMGPQVADILSWATERSCAQMLAEDASPARRRQLAEQLTHVVWSAIAA
ncbi:MAG: TetR/AcrR family transcriptional regulator [Pseudomonadota bacterium]